MSHVDEQFICATTNSKIFGLSSKKDFPNLIIKYSYSVHQFMHDILLFDNIHPKGQILTTSELTLLKLLHNSAQL